MPRLIQQAPEGRKKEEEEQAMRDNLKKAQDEAEVMRLRRLKEEEAERLRL